MCGALSASDLFRYVTSPSAGVTVAVEGCTNATGLDHALINYQPLVASLLRRAARLLLTELSPESTCSYGSDGLPMSDSGCDALHNLFAGEAHAVINLSYELHVTHTVVCYLLVVALAELVVDAAAVNALILRALEP